MHPLKGIRIQILVHIIAKTSHDGEDHAFADGTAKSDTKIIFIKIVKKTILRRIDKLAYIVRQIIFYGIGTSRKKCFCQMIRIHKCAEAFFQCADDRLFMFLCHTPDRQLFILCISGISAVKNVSKRTFTAAKLQQRNALCASLYPSAEILAPNVIFRTSDCRRALCVDHDLISESIFVLICRRTEKGFPNRRIFCEIPQRSVVFCFVIVYFTQ
ncbi:MAG: hypothetical protein IJV87_04930 [Clostridia bacterium]|nr:hypothetical protein [Clostridia bacterium]